MPRTYHGIRKLYIITERPGTYNIETYVKLPCVEITNYPSARGRTTCNSMSTSVITACESCRSRKVKCDKVHPRCRQCAKHGIDCVFVHKRIKKGPRKGELERLKAQVGMLVRRLSLLCLTSSFLRINKSGILTISAAILEQKLAVQQTEVQSTSPPIYSAGEVAANEAPRSEHIAPQTEPEAHHADLGGDLVSDPYAGSNKDAVWHVRADPELMSWLDVGLSTADLSLPVDQTTCYSPIWNISQLGVGLGKIVKADL